MWWSGGPGATRWWWCGAPGAPMAPAMRPGRGASCWWSTLAPTSSKPSCACGACYTTPSASGELDSLERELHFRTLALLRGQPHPAAGLRHQLLADGQAQARANAHRLGGEERLEDLLLQLRGD